VPAKLGLVDLERAEVLEPALRADDEILLP
jgi:hypothetical protein